MILKTTTAEKLVLATLNRKARDARGWSLSTLWTATGKTAEDCNAISSEGGLEAVVKSLVSKGLVTFESFGPGKPRRANLVVEQAA